MSMSGGCLCGGVQYKLEGQFSSPVACHCSQCARTSGNFAAMAACRTRELSVTVSETLSWFKSSESVKRGFCSRCGGNVFWIASPGEETYVTAGTIDKPTGLQLAEHIFIHSKSDFYVIADGLPQKEEW